MFYSHNKPKQLSVKELDAVCNLKSSIQSIDVDIKALEKTVNSTQQKPTGPRHLALIEKEDFSRRYDRGHIVSEDTKLLTFLWEEIMNRKLNQLKEQRRQLVTQIKEYVPDFV
jgi:hypothetical protein